jgi:hypothetical protein
VCLHQVFVLAGLPASGRRTVANLLLQDFPDRLVAGVVYAIRSGQAAYEASADGAFSVLYCVPISNSSPNFY